GITDLVLSRSEPGKAPARLKLRGGMASHQHVLAQRALDRSAHARLVERLLQKIHRSTFHRLNAGRDRAVARQKYNRDLRSGASQLLLHLEAVHLGHLQVEKDTSRPILRRVSEEFRSRPEGLDVHPDRVKKPRQ